MKRFSLFLFIFFVNIAQANTPKVFAKVEKLVGTSQLDGKAIRSGDKISQSGLLKTGDKSLLRLYMSNWNSSIVVGPNTEMSLDLSSTSKEKPERYVLKKGLCRWVSFMKSSLLKESHVFTKSAAMGIRGTDFEIKNEDSGETEIIVFSGEVLLKSKLADSEQLVKKGQWGGVGGKFGDQVKAPVDLNEEQLAKARARTQKLISTSHKNKTDSPMY